MSGGLSCTICANKYKTADEIDSTYCGHIFHTQCMQEWKERSTSCPQCRRENITTHRVYLDIEDSEESIQNVNQLKAELEEIKQRLAEVTNEKDLELVAVKSQFESELARGEEDLISLCQQFSKKAEEIQQLQDENETLSAQLEVMTFRLNEHSNVRQIINGISGQHNEDVEERFVTLISHFEKNIASAANLKHELQQSEQNFLSLHQQYNEKDEEIQQLKMKVEYLSVQLEHKNSTARYVDCDGAEIDDNLGIHVAETRPTTTTRNEENNTIVNLAEDVIAERVESTSLSTEEDDATGVICK